MTGEASPIALLPTPLWCSSQGRNASVTSSLILPIFLFSACKRKWLSWSLRNPGAGLLFPRSNSIMYPPPGIKQGGTPWLILSKTAYSEMMGVFQSEIWCCTQKGAHIVHGNQPQLPLVGCSRTCFCNKQKHIIIFEIGVPPHLSCSVSWIITQ